MVFSVPFNFDKKENVTVCNDCANKEGVFLISEDTFLCEQCYHEFINIHSVFEVNNNLATHNARVKRNNSM